MRVGLNSGQVIAGEMGSGPVGYTAIGEQVGMAQRMESVAPPGGVMLSARPPLDWLKAQRSSPSLEHGADQGRTTNRLRAHRLLASCEARRHLSGVLSRIWSVGGGRCPPSRLWWTSAIDGHGGVVGVVQDHRASARAVWCARWRRLATDRRVEVVSPPSASRTPARHPIPCRRTNLLRTATGVAGLDGRPPAAGSATGFPTQTRRIWRCSMTCWASPIPMRRFPAIDPDARRRRLTALVNAASLARATPALFIIEDAHWIDAVSESMLADFLTRDPADAARWC